MTARLDHPSAFPLAAPLAPHTPAPELAALASPADLVVERVLGLVLAPYVVLSQADGTIVTTAAFGRIPRDRQIVVYLLARQALRLLGLIPSAVAAPRMIQEALQITGGTVRPTLAGLVRRHVVSLRRQLNGRLWYEITPAGVGAAVAFLEDHGTDRIAPGPAPAAGAEFQTGGSFRPLTETEGDHAAH